MLTFGRLAVVGGKCNEQKKRAGRVDIGTLFGCDPVTQRYGDAKIAQLQFPNLHQCRSSLFPPMDLEPSG